ncbi:MAG TPA: hypothetical protein PKA63_13165 [Oligoflexia bacterium]|nr:hypothetical protein [Oligoflexia bacterium]HMP49610.1 hypothetical protein [Oligoflexia bacterium]
MKGMQVKKDIQELERVAGRAGSDTIRLWEGYREQAFFWRALSLIQVPGTALAIAAALSMFFFADTIIEVPEHPQPGFYSVKQLPDSQFINVAREVVNLISTYQPAVVERQFRTARRYLWEPALSEFESTMLTTELNAVLETKRSQMFFINPRLIKVERFPEHDTVVVRIPGLRQKLIGNQPLAPDELAYYVKMTTIPRNVHNEYGIVITDIHLRRAGEKVIKGEDHAVNTTKARQARASGK